LFRIPAAEIGDRGVRQRIFGRLRALLRAVGGPVAGFQDRALHLCWSLLHGRLELASAGLLGAAQEPDSPEILARQALSLLLDGSLDDPRTQS